MKHEVITSHSFVSDDGRLGIYMEVEGTKIVSIMLAKKSGAKIELKPEDLNHLAEISADASSFFLDKDYLSEAAAG